MSKQTGGISQHEQLMTAGESEGAIKPTRFSRGIHGPPQSHYWFMQIDCPHKTWYNMGMRMTYKYRLFPASAQRTMLEHTLEQCRLVYNRTLAMRKSAWEQGQKPVSRYDTIKMLPVWKEELTELKYVHSQVLQEVCTRVDLAFRHFFRRVKAGEKPGYPRFKGKGWYKSFTYPQSGFKLLDNGRLRLSKIGDVRIKLHRPIEGEIKTLTVKRDMFGNWYACFSVEVEPQPLEPSPDVVGIDVGLSDFATLSTGEKVANPRFFRKEETALAKAQRRLSKCEKGTVEFRKYKRVVQHIHQRIANKRRDFSHKLSRKLVDTYQFIALEDLNIQDMQDGNYRSMNKSIGDAAWHQLVQHISYKAEKAGRTVVLVDPRNTTKECSDCHAIVPKKLSNRVHSCPFCGCVLDRDLNAALNILARGLASMGANP